MTVITKVIGEKKSDNLQEPLVENIVVEHDEAKKNDIEAGGYPVPPPQTTRYIISARVKPYYSLMFILMLVLLVATSLLGIFGTEYLYEQYRYLMNSEPQPEVYRAWGTLSYDDEPAQLAYENKIPGRFERTQETEDINRMSMFLQSDSGSNVDEDRNKDFLVQLNEEIEVDGNKDRLETMVPAKGNSRFVHDFYSNYTAIVDIDNHRCFIMPLDRSALLPPRSLYDLIMKMQKGYYSMDTEKVRRDMRVSERIDNSESLGMYINKECQDFTTYKLEKIVGGVVKRSIENTETYTYFDGKKIMEINVLGVAESVPRAVP